jgi:uncharacterized membrane protein
MMTEQQIEESVARKVDALDRRYLNGALTEDEYQQAIRNLDAWAEEQYRASKRGN